MIVVTRKQCTQLLCTAVTMWLFACDPPPSDPAQDAETLPARSTASSWVEVKRPMDLSLLELPAQVIGDTSARAHIEAPLRGTIVSVLVQVGDRVQVGTPLMELRMPDVLQAAATLDASTQQLRQHENRRDRLRVLQNDGLVGASEVFAIESEIGQLTEKLELARATLDAAGVRARERSTLLRRGFVVLRAPLDGVVMNLEAVPGASVDAGESLAYVHGRGAARVEIAWTGALPSDLQLEFIVAGAPSVALQSKPIATAIEPRLGRTMAWFEPVNPAELSHGMRGIARIHSHRESLLEVPQRSLRLIGSKTWVARKNKAGDEVEAIEVEVMRALGASALIQSNTLQLGDRIASDAATVLGLELPMELTGNEGV